MIEVLAIAILWILAGIVYCNALEWLVHKYVLHGFGKKKDSVWRFHWSHHKSSRQNTFKERRWDDLPLYEDREFWGIVGLLIIHIPTAWISPVFFFTLMWRAFDYYRVNKKVHDKEEWAKKKVQWYWDDDLGPGKGIEGNWCVRCLLLE